MERPSEEPPVQPTHLHGPEAKPKPSAAASLAPAKEDADAFLEALEEEIHAMKDAVKSVN